MVRAMPRTKLISTLSLALLIAAPGTARAATVVVRPAAGARLHLSAAGGEQTVGRVARLGLRVVRVSGDPAAAAARLSHRPGVRWAEANATVHALDAVPNDPLFARTPLTRLGAPAAWDALRLGSFRVTGGVKVGIVDTGIDASHEDLAGKVAACATSTDGTIATGACDDDQGHGTHVSGTIGALANNGVGLAGVAFSSPLVVCKALSADGSGTDADVAACIRWTHDQGAKVISMSLGGPTASRTIAAATRYAWENGGRGGSVLVAAAGNDGTSAVEYPAGRPEVVSVGAVDGADALASFSNRNDDVELTAPGVDVLSTLPGNRYATESGTSMATPHVSGAAALLWGAHPRVTANAVRTRLDAAVADLGAPGRDPEFGFGRLDLSVVGR
jgi:thermitase